MNSRLEYMMPVSVKMMSIPLCRASLKISDSNFMINLCYIASM